MREIECILIHTDKFAVWRKNKTAEEVAATFQQICRACAVGDLVFLSTLPFVFLDEKETLNV